MARVRRRLNVPRNVNRRRRLSKVSRRVRRNRSSNLGRSRHRTGNALVQSRNTAKFLTNGVLPYKTIAKHYYVSYGTIVGIGSQANWNYKLRANSVYDPDLTAVGHQPYMTDTMRALYANACVIGAKVTATLHYQKAVSAVNNGPVLFAMTVCSNNDETRHALLDSAGLTSTEFIEKRLGKYKTLTSGDTRAHTATLSTKISFKKLFKLKSMLEQSTTNDGQEQQVNPTGSTNPLLEGIVRLHILQEPTFPAGATTTFNYHRVVFKIDQLTLWNEPKAFAGS